MAGASLPPSLSGTPSRTSPSGAPGGPPGRGGEEPAGGRLERVAAAFTDWSERWIPDAFVFALVATVAVVLAGAASGAGLGATIGHWGDGFWELLPFTLQMALVIILGHVLATTGPVFRVIAWLAARPTTPRGGVALVTAFALLASWFNWGFGLIFSALLAREVARRIAGVDYRALGAASLLGLGSIWAQGLSGSAALQMASSSSMPAATRAIVAGSQGQIAGGVIPLSRTIFLPQSLVSVVVEIVVVTAIMTLATPSPSRARTAAQLGVDLGESPLERPDPERRGTPGDWLEHSPALGVLFVAGAAFYLWRTLVHGGQGLGGLTLNVVNLVFLTLGFALHRTPARLMRAVREATPGAWAVFLQFPFYAGVAAVMTHTSLSATLAHAFVRVSSPGSFPAIVALYSAVLGVLVPSGGSKWVIEAPYVMQAAHDLRVHLGWMVAVYDLGEALANLVQPFWMLPVLGLLGLRARDVMGYTLLVFVVLTPLVLVLVTVLGATLSYPL